MVKTNRLSFKGQSFFVGIDVHKRQWSVTIRSKGTFLKTFSMNPDPAELKNYLTKTYPDGTFLSTYEAGFSGYWIHRELQASGINNIIVNPADVPTSHKEKDRKTDPLDSKKLSRELGNGTLQGIYIPNLHQESYRVLTRCLRQYNSRSTQVKNRIKMLLNFLGIHFDGDDKKHWSKAYLKKLSEIKFQEELNHIAMNHHLEEIKHIRKSQLGILRTFRKIAKENKIIKLLRTIPGIGLKTAFVLYAELIDIRRFEGFDHLASFVGLVPATGSSGEKDLVKGITNRHCRHLRYMLIESAWIAVRTDPVFTMCFNSLVVRMAKNRAIIRMAKKLLRRIRTVWFNQQEYVQGIVETASSPTKRSCVKQTLLLAAS